MMKASLEIACKSSRGKSYQNLQENQYSLKLHAINSTCTGNLTDLFCDFPLVTMITAPKIDKPIPNRSFDRNRSFSTECPSLCDISEIVRNFLTLKLIVHSLQGAIKQFAIRATVPKGATTDAGAKA